MICRDTPTHVWVCGWLGGSVGQWLGSGQDNSILFEDLWFVETPPPMGVWLGGSVGQWLGSGQMNQSLDLIEIIQFCLKIYDL